jgi:hypothetical protein
MKEGGMRVQKAAGAFCLLMMLSRFAAATEPTMDSYPIDSTGNMMPRWDEANHRVLSYQLQTVADQVAVQITAIDRAQPTIRISVLKDFPGAVESIVVAVASGPDQSVLVACRLKYPSSNHGPSALKELILTYNGAGRLIKVWDVAPYEPTAIASDESGNVYSFGVRVDVFNTTHVQPDYGMLVEYSPDGKVLRGMLPASLFPAGIDPSSYSSETGPRVISVSRDRIYVYAARVSEVFVLDRSGDILKRYSILNFARDLAARNHYAYRELIVAAFDSDGNLYLDMGLGEPTAKGIPDQMRIGAKLSGDLLHSSQWPFPREVVAKEITVDRRMIGTTADGSVVSLVRKKGECSVEISRR